MPLRRPVPINVPMVSNVSERLKEKIVIRTSGIFAGSENRLPIPPSLKMARNVVGSAAQASEKLTDSFIVVTPNGIPIMVVAIIAMSTAPFTLSTRSTIISARPIRNTQKLG